MTTKKKQAMNIRTVSFRASRLRDDSDGYVALDISTHTFGGEHANPKASELATMDTYVFYAPDCKRQRYSSDCRLEVPRTREALLAIRALIDAELGDIDP